MRACAGYVFACFLLTGCNLNRIAADQTAKVIEAGAAGPNGFFDYEMAGQAMASAILQGEALLSVSPENESLALGLAKTYVSYAYGWVADEWEQADDAGDFERADALEKRAMYLYLRAAKLALKFVHERDDDGRLDEKLKTGKADAVIAYAREVFTDRDDVAALYWAGLAWGSAIANSGGDLKMFADAAVARSLLERSVELAPDFADAGGLGVLGTVEAQFPELFGGSLEKSQAYYERALAVCKRKNHLVLLGYARNYAVAKQDRALYETLLREILEAPDQGTDIRLANKVARHRAERYLRQAEHHFDPALQ